LTVNTDKGRHTPGAGESPRDRYWALTDLCHAFAAPNEHGRRMFSAIRWLSEGGASGAAFGWSLGFCAVRRIPDSPRLFGRERFRRLPTGDVQHSDDRTHVVRATRGCLGGAK